MQLAKQTAVRPTVASRRVAVKPVAKLSKPAASKASLAAAAAVVALSAAHPVSGRVATDPDTH